MQDICSDASHEAAAFASGGSATEGGAPGAAAPAHAFGQARGLREFELHAAGRYLDLSRSVQQVPQCEVNAYFVLWLEYRTSACRSVFVVLC